MRLALETGISSTFTPSFLAIRVATSISRPCGLVGIDRAERREVGRHGHAQRAVLLDIVQGVGTGSRSGEHHGAGHQAEQEFGQFHSSF
jgi:hypothetical protein